jgi:hypothetical protein
MKAKFSSEKSVDFPRTTWCHILEDNLRFENLKSYKQGSIQDYILLYTHPLLGNALINKFPRRQILGKQSVARSRNNRTNVDISLLSNSQRTNGLAR